MHFSYHRRGAPTAAGRMTLIALCFLSAAIVASSAAEKQPAVALQTLEFEKPVNWYFVSDIGVLHVHGDGKIHTFDLLDNARALTPPLSFPLADDPLSVVHISGTETLLIASARSGKIRADAAGGDLSSYGVDLLSGKLLWEQPSLALPRESYYFPEEDLVILQSGEKGHDYTAVDRSTGAARWSKEAKGSHVLLKDDTLVILGPESSEIDLRTGRPVWTLDLNVGGVFAKDGTPRTRVRINREIAKRGRAGDVFLPDRLVPKLRRFWRFKVRRGESLEAGEPLLCAQSGRRLSKRRVQFLWRTWQTKAGFDRLYPFHAIRHSAVTNVYRATRDLFLAQRFARHASPLTTTAYTHPSDGEMLQRIRGLDC